MRKAEFTTGAVYLAGYGVECILKALVLSCVPLKKQEEILRAFRGNQAHSYEWLREQYLTLGGTKLPAKTTQHFTLVNAWSTDLRYSPRDVRASEAEEFLASANSIIAWADGRL